MNGQIIQGDYLEQMRQRDLRAARSEFYVIPKTTKGKVLAAGLAAVLLAYNAWDINRLTKDEPKQQSKYSFFYEPSR